MLTSSANQYLRPEYLSPLPTTLDAKKSPLALLAQTCSNIGADTNSKPLITHSDRTKDRDNDKKKSGRDSSSVNSEDGCNSGNSGNSVQSNKFSFKPYESSITSKKDRDSSDRSASVEVSDSKKSPHHKISSPTTSHSHANNSSSVRVSPTIRPSSGGKSSPFIGNSSDNGSNSVKSDNGKSKSPSNLNLSNSSNSSSTSNNVTHTTNTLSDLARSMDSHELSLHYAAAAKANGLNFGACCPTPASAAAALGNLKGVDNKSQPYPTFSPYSLAGYAPMHKGINGSFLSASPCREPNCYNCQLSAAFAGRMAQSVCPSGCTQCNHDRIPTSLLSPNYPALQALGPMAAYNSSLYHAFAQTGSPLVPQSNVCSWIMPGDRYCGKRFATSEELLNHLRTHTAEMNANSLFNPLSSLSACHYANLVSAAAAASSNSPPSLTTSAGLRRTAYPGLSDVSPLTNRYHPYKPTAMPVIGGIPSPQLQNLSPLPSAALNMYYSYGLHGQRIGPPVHH